MSFFMGRCAGGTPCDVMGVYRKRGLCAKTRTCPVQSGSKGKNGICCTSQRHTSKRWRPVLVPPILAVLQFETRVFACGLRAESSRVPALRIAESHGRRRMRENGRGTWRKCAEVGECARPTDVRSIARSGRKAWQDGGGGDPGRELPRRRRRRVRRTSSEPGMDLRRSRRYGNNGDGSVRARKAAIPVWRPDLARGSASGGELYK